MALFSRLCVATAAAGLVLTLQGCGGGSGGSGSGGFDSEIANADCPMPTISFDMRGAEPLTSATLKLGVSGEAFKAEGCCNAMKSAEQIIQDALKSNSTDGLMEKLENAMLPCLSAVLDPSEITAWAEVTLAGNGAKVVDTSKPCTVSLHESSFNGTALPFDMTEDVTLLGFSSDFCTATKNLQAVEDRLREAGKTAQQIAEDPDFIAAIEAWQKAQLPIPDAVELQGKVIIKPKPQPPGANLAAVLAQHLVGQVERAQEVASRMSAPLDVKADFII